METKKAPTHMNNLIQHTTDLAMHIVQAYVHPGDTVVDATCGNGHDTLRLARRALQKNEPSWHSPKGSMVSCGT